MVKPGEHKTVQARILKYAQEIGWLVVSRAQAEQRRGFDPDALPKDRAKGSSLFFDDLLDTKVREFNPRYAEAEGALLGKFCHLHSDIYGNREFVEHLRNRGKFFDHEEDRERDLLLIDYDDLSRNTFEVTGKFAFHNGHCGTRENVEPLGYKAFLVGVDREACAHYKHALDKFLPPEYSKVVYTGNNDDSKLLKEFHLDPKKERQIRKSFCKFDQQPKILIVTEKLLTGFDAPILYAMYLDKLEKALAFDSEEVNAIVKDLKLLKLLFENKMASKAPEYLGLIDRSFDDKNVDAFIELQA